MTRDDTNRPKPTHTGDLDRRTLLRRAAAVGLALPALGTVSWRSIDRAWAQGSAPAFNLEALVEGAKREGGVIFAGNAIQADETKKALPIAFREKYGLPASFAFDIVVKPIGQLQKQIEDEMVANKVSVDVIAMNVLAWAAALAKRNKLMPFETPEYEAYDHLGPGMVNRPYYVSDPTITWNIAWNSDLIKGNDFQSWFDLLRPEYKGKMTVISGRLSQSAAVNFKGMRETPAIGMDFFKRLAELEPVTVTLTDTAVVKLQSGEFPITLVPSTRPYAAWKRGARNIGQSFAKEGVVALGVPWMITAEAPHPNAAKLLVHFARSREGQQLLADQEGRISARKDVKSPNPIHVPDVSKLKLIKIDEVNIEQQEFRALGQEWRTLFGT
jgi:iron(III) transport system substrate-binding protein